MSTRREELLDAAESVLERHGLENFGINALARAVGVKPPSLYKHFSGIVEIEHALISRWFQRMAVELNAAEQSTAGQGQRERVRAFAAGYRRVSRDGPQLYRLATDRALDRRLLDAGVEEAAMAAVLRFFRETPRRHDRARLVWAAAHGLVVLELAGRFPPDADVDTAWEMLAETFSA